VQVALTFDDGPGPSTPELLDVLAEQGVRATFFLLGRNVEAQPEVVVRLLLEGHVVGNHSYSHPRPEGIAPAAFAAEIRRTDQLVETLAARAAVKLPWPLPVRLPYGPVAGDPRLAALAALGRTHVHWTGDFEDWKDPPAELLAARMRAHLVAQEGAGLPAVLDLHDSSRLSAPRRSTVEAVRILCATGGLEWFTVPAPPAE
jgi:chitin deacetylase